jgi:hypothetical protein
MMCSLANTPSNHLPCVVNIGIAIPHSNIFNYEYYWVDHPSLIGSIKQSWEHRSHKSYSFDIMANKLKTRDF